MPGIRVALAQVNLEIGSFDENLETMASQVELAKQAGASLVVFPTFATTGYPPGDLVLRRSFITDNLRCIAELAKLASGIAILAGYIEHSPGEGALFNAMALCENGEVVRSIGKAERGVDGNFVEQRYFASKHPQTADAVVTLGLLKIGVVWGLSEGDRLTAELGANGVDLVLNVEPWSFYVGGQTDIEAAISGFAATRLVPVASLNHVGAQDETIFGGGSFAVNNSGEVVARAKSLGNDLVLVEITTDSGSPVLVPSRIEPLLTDVEAAYKAILLGTKEYLRKNGFTDALVSISGGIDSALVAALARDALGPDRVHGVMLPSRYSSEHSVTDAVALAENLGIAYRVIEIEPVHAAFLDLLEPHFSDREPDVTEENLQARIRGVIVMALSNKFGWLALAGSNKTELAVGYSTMYGDAVGGLAILADVPKLSVYALARYHNQIHGRANIPEAILTKAPSAELRPGQSDDQTLPPYEILDPLVVELVENDRSIPEVVGLGYDEVTARRVASLIDKSEFKRRQGPPGLKISRRPLGVGRDMPMTHKYRG